VNYPAVADEWTQKNALSPFHQIAHQRTYHCLARFFAWPEYFSYTVSICTVLDDQLTPIAAGGLLLLTLAMGAQSAWTAIRPASATSRELSDAKLRAEKANAAKSLFLALVSHEIRTLLYGMLASIELIGKTRLDEVQTQLSTAMACSARTLKDVLNNALDFTRNETEAIDVVCRDFDLCAEIDSVRQAFSARATLKGLQLHCRIDPALAGLWHGDALKLAQILNNLLNNAVKFTAQGSVTMAAKLVGDHAVDGDPVDGTGAGRGAARYIALSVRDTGPGIAAEDAERIFSLFGQAHAADGGAPFAGTGLGLYICKRFAAAMGGTIDLVSTPGGSNFTLRIALQRAGAGSGDAAAAASVTTDAAATVIADTASALPERQGRIGAEVLIVDDQPINRLLLEKQLSYFGCQVTTAANGAEALAHERCFDLILTDLNMPGLDGYALARIWRATGVACPIIAITAGHAADERERCLAAGMNGYLLKPFTMDDLAQLLGRRVGLQSAERQDAHSPRGALHRWQPETMRTAVAALTCDLSELAQCTAASDIGHLRKVVHRIHGGVALLEMRPAAALCRAIEESIEFEWTQEALQLIPVLQIMLTQIRGDIDPGEETDFE
jgi:signal transduction histidine kinase/FixJ family two-component response regulator